MAIKPSSNLSKLLEETPEAYYWSGFITADGYINHSNRPRLSIRIQKRDEKHLIKFANFVNFQHSLKEYRGYPSLDLRDKKSILEFATKFDLKKDKTHNPPDFVKLNFSNRSLAIAYMAGFIDGDGHISRNNHDNPCIDIACHFNCKDFLQNLKKCIYSSLNFSDKYRHNGRQYKDRNTDMFRVTIGHRKVLESFKKEVYLLNLPILKRKWSVI